jgi:tRNA-modifying protein YgfZ
MQMPWSSVALDSVGVLRARGAEVHAFLQGQLSNDMSRLSAERSLFAGYHNAQGRAIALLRLLQLAPDDVLALMPRELVPVVVARLSKFVLRAKVKLSDDTPQWQLAGVVAPGEQPPAADPYAALMPPLGGVRQVADSTIVRLGESPARVLLVRAAAAPPLENPVPLALNDWRLAAIAAGEPQVYAATSEEFVAQMLNLDVLNGISFEKGCYTGQEVIARAHFRGRVKRRMQRFLSEAPAHLKPADSVKLADGRAAQVVEAAQRADGRCEFLAVAALTAEVGSAAPQLPAGTALPATQLPLHYALPE